MATTAWISDISGNWSSGANWSSGVPGVGDDVFFTAAHNGGCNVNSVVAASNFSSFNMSGYSGTISFNTSFSVAGSATFSSSGSVTDGGGTLSLTGAGTLTSNGQTLPGIVFASGAGTVTLADNLSAGAVQINSGTLNTSNKTCTFTSVSLGSGATTVLTLGTSTVNITGTGSFWNISSNTGLSISAASSTIKISAASSSARTFVGSGYTYGTLDYTVAGSTGGLTITGSNTFADIKFSDASNARTLTFTDSTTTTLTSGFHVNGSTNGLMTIANSSTVAGHTHTLTYSGAGTISCNYLSISRSTANQSNTWYAGNKSVDGGNNTNWIFSSPVTMFYKTPSSLLADFSNTKTLVIKNAIGSAATILLSLQNNTSGANNAPQFSPGIEFVGQGYTGSVSATNKYLIQAQSVSGTWSATGRSGDGYLAILPSYNGASYSASGGVLIDGYGDLKSKGFIIYNGTTAQLPLVSPWINIPFVNSFSNYGAPYNNFQYFKDAFGVVHFRGAWKGPGGGGSATAFTMPAGYRPAAIVDFCICTNTSYSSFGGFQFPANGVVSTTNAQTFLLMDGMSYVAEQ